MVIEQTLISAERFWELTQQPEFEESLLELVEGELVEMSKPGGRHGLIAGNIFGYLWNYVREHQLGYVTAAETGFILKQSPDGRDTVRGLDAAFIAKEAAPDGFPDGLIPFAPTLAVEVISPGNSAESIHQKVLDLLAVGTKAVWVVYPESQTIVVHTAQMATTHHSDATLTTPDFLPGFELKVEAVFSTI